MATILGGAARTGPVRSGSLSAATRLAYYPGPVRSWVIYSLVRVGLFAATFALLYWLLPPDLWWLAAVCAALIALSLSYIFLAKLRDRVTADLAARAEHRRASRPADPDAAAEDS